MVTELQDKLKVTFDNGLTIMLKKPNRQVLGQMLAATRKDPLGAADVILTQCLIEGDKSIKEKAGYLHQVNKMIDDIFGKQAAVLEFTEDGNAQILFSDDKICTLRPATRQEYSAAQAAAKINPLRFIEDILKKCWLKGDEDIKASAAHLLGFAEVLDEFVSYTGEAIKN